MRIRLIPILLFPVVLFGQMKGFSGIHDSVNKDLVNFLERSNFGKVTFYFDRVNHEEGHWEIYPTLNINDSLVAVSISTMPGKANKYTFLIFVNVNNMSVQEWLGPYYDSQIDALKVKVKNYMPDQVAIRLINPPEPHDPKFTFYEYERIGSHLVQTKAYTKK